MKSKVHNSIKLVVISVHEKNYCKTNLNASHLTQQYKILLLDVVIEESEPHLMYTEKIYYTFLILFFFYFAFSNIGFIS